MYGFGKPEQKSGHTNARRRPDLTVSGSRLGSPRRADERSAGDHAAIGPVGDCHDNAVAGSATGLFRTEVIRRRGPWRNLESVEYATLQWVDWIDNRRLLEPIANIWPAGRERAYYAQEEAPAMAAGLT